LQSTSTTRSSTVRPTTTTTSEEEVILNQNYKYVFYHANKYQTILGTDYIYIVIANIDLDYVNINYDARGNNLLFIVNIIINYIKHYLLFDISITIFLVYFDRSGYDDNK